MFRVIDVFNSLEFLCTIVGKKKGFFGNSLTKYMHTWTRLHYRPFTTAQETYVITSEV